MTSFVLGAAGCLPRARGSSNIPSLPTFALFWLVWRHPYSTPLGLRMASNSPFKAWVCLPIDYHNPSVYPMSTGARPRREPRVVDNNSHLFPFSCHFSNFWAPRLFSSMTLLGPRVLTNGYGCLKPSFLAHLYLILAPLATPFLYSVWPLDGVEYPVQGMSVPSKGCTPWASVPGLDGSPET